jgi:peroxiredoxin
MRQFRLKGPKGGKANMVEIGKEAPDFRLKDQDGNFIRLSELRGKKVLVSFRPLAWTAV